MPSDAEAWLIGWKEDLRKGMKEERRLLVKIATPIIATNVAWVIMGIANLAIVGRCVL